jgi:hypothetical protein
MGARQKLNAAYFNGCLIVSGLVGLVAQSWTLFGLALIVSFGLCCRSGEIRHRPETWRRGRGR